MYSNQRSFSTGKRVCTGVLALIRLKVRTVPKSPRRRRTRPFSVVEPTDPDERIPEGLRELPRRIEEANQAGPRYNQSELAIRSGLSQSVISKLAGSTNLFGVRLDTVYKLAAALNVSVSYLLGESDDPTRQTRPRKKRPR